MMESKAWHEQGMVVPRAERPDKACAAHRDLMHRDLERFLYILRRMVRDIAPQEAVLVIGEPIQADVRIAMEIGHDDVHGEIEKGVVYKGWGKQKQDYRSHCLTTFLNYI